jgi:hypothetical protein
VLSVNIIITSHYLGFMYGSDVLCICTVCMKHSALINCVPLCTSYVLSLCAQGQLYLHCYSACELKYVYHISNLKETQNISFKYVLYQVILAAKGQHVHCQLYVHKVHVCINCMVQFSSFVKAKCVSFGNIVFTRWLLEHWCI